MREHCLGLQEFGYLYRELQGVGCAGFAANVRFWESPETFLGLEPAEGGGKFVVEQGGVLCVQVETGCG